MLLAIGGEDLLSTGEIPSILPITTPCPSFNLPEGRDSHVAFNPPYSKDEVGQISICFVCFNSNWSNTASSLIFAFEHLLASTFVYQTVSRTLFSNLGSGFYFKFRAWFAGAGRPREAVSAGTKWDKIGSSTQPSGRRK